MHQPHPTLTPTDYANLYQACINTGWDEASLDLQVVRIETAAATRGYVAAALKGLRHEGPPPPPPPPQTKKPPPAPPPPPPQPTPPPPPVFENAISFAQNNMYRRRDSFLSDSGWWGSV